jgi:hypothetical protein
VEVVAYRQVDHRHQRHDVVPQDPSGFPEIQAGMAFGRVGQVADELCRDVRAEIGVGAAGDGQPGEQVLGHRVARRVAGPGRQRVGVGNADQRGHGQRHRVTRADLSPVLYKQALLAHGFKIGPWPDIPCMNLPQGMVRAWRRHGHGATRHSMSCKSYLAA